MILHLPPTKRGIMRKQNSFRGKILELFRGTNNDRELRAKINRQEKVTSLHREIEDEVNVVTNQFRAYMNKRIYEILKDKL